MSDTPRDPGELPSLVSYNDIATAAHRLAGVATRTPLLPAETAGLSTLWLKPENLQPIGAFKIRGAFNAVAKLPEEVRGNGVVAFSSGNHAQGVAYAARRFGIPAWIVIEDSAPQVKVDATEALGAHVVLAPMEDRENVAAELCTLHGAALIPSFSHLDVIAGQGTVGLEIFEDLPSVDTILVPVSGGGLASGVAAALKHLSAKVQVIIVEPDLAGDTAESLAAGHLVRWTADDRRRSIADGLGGQPTDLSFAHLQRYVDGAITVSEDELRHAVQWLGRHFNVVAEPAGAATTAAYLHHVDHARAGTTVAIISGGNIAPALHADIVSEHFT